MPRRRSLAAEGSLVAVLAAAIAAIAGCVDVPDSVRAQFAGPGAHDRSNYRPGRHGVEPPPAAKASPPAEADASVEAEADADAETDTDAAADADGGAV